MADATVLELLRNEVAELERRLANRRKMLEIVENEEHEVTVAPGEFEGMETATAITRYLRKVDRPAHIYDEVFPALIKGGCDLGPAADKRGHDRRPRHLMTTARMNGKKPSHPFIINDDDMTIRLRHPEQLKVGKSA